MFRPTKSPYRSECPILPNTRPSGEKMPSMDMMEPLGLTSMSREGTPAPSTYWVATWPLAMSWSITAWGPTKRPSPWEMGMACRSPTWDFSIQGERTEATRVVTYRLWCRPIRL